MKTTEYFEYRRSASDRKEITDEMIVWALRNSTRIITQKDGRIRVWANIGNRYLRIVLLADGETVHNAFFDRSFKEQNEG